MKILMLGQTSMPIPSPKNKIFAPGMIFNSIAEGLQKKGHEVTIFASSDSSSRVKTIHKNIPSTHSLNIQDTKERTYRSYQHQMYIASEAIKEYQSGKYDLLHLDEFRVAPYFSEFVEGPITCTYHGTSDKDNDLKFDLDKLRQKKYYKKIKFIAVTEKQRELGLDYFNFVETVHHGIDMSSFDFSDKASDRLVFVGRMIKNKNPDIAINVASKSNVPIDLVGDYSDQDNYYNQKVKPKIDGKKIKFIGHVLYTNMDNIYRNAKALLFPITWDEAFGLVVIEAMACGTPVIAFDRGAMKELIVDGVTGFIVKEGDIDGMVEAVKKIDTIDRKKCREHVEKNFSEEIMVAGYEKVFKKIINQ